MTDTEQTTLLQTFCELMLTSPFIIRCIIFRQQGDPQACSGSSGSTVLVFAVGVFFLTQVPHGLVEPGDNKSSPHSSMHERRSRRR